MDILHRLLNCVAATFLSFFLFLPPVQAGEAELEALFDELKKTDLPNWEQVEEDIWEEWSRSGSPAIDLLLDRGRRAMSNRRYGQAIEHFSAIIDHAPDFAEAWNARATAFFGAERYGQAIADIEQTLARNPRHFGAMQGLARILEELGDFDSALKASQAAFAIHPHRPGLKETIERLESKASGQDI
ncbi:MAG: tetratricopeptide repeat protein [Litoreibacter sp.]